MNNRTEKTRSCRLPQAELFRSAVNLLSTALVSGPCVLRATEFGAT